MKRYEAVLQKGKSRVCFSVLEKSMPEYVQILQNLYSQDLEEIVPPPEEEKETSKKIPVLPKQEIEQGIHEVSEEIALKEAEVKKAYEFPPMEL